MLTDLLKSVTIEVDDDLVLVSASVGPLDKREWLDLSTAHEVADSLDHLSDQLREAADEVSDNA
jgi:hypothetical protein